MYEKVRGVETDMAAGSEEKGDNGWKDEDDDDGRAAEEMSWVRAWRVAWNSTCLVDMEAARDSRASVSVRKKAASEARGIMISREELEDGVGKDKRREYGRLTDHKARCRREVTPNQREDMDRQRQGDAGDGLKWEGV